MFLQGTRRFKDGKEHRYWSIVESRRCVGGRVVQRPILYLGESEGRAAWRQAAVGRAKPDGAGAKEPNQ